MPLPILLTSASSVDLVEARDWYERQSPGLGKEFIRMVNTGMASIARQPEGFPTIHRSLRRVLVRRFPYAIFYRVEPHAVRVVAVLHAKMDLRRLSDRD